MNNISKYIFSLFIIILTMSGCFPNLLDNSQTISPTMYPSSTLENSSPSISTATRLPSITQPPTLDLPPLLTPRVTPFLTLSLVEATDNLMYMLQTNGDCKFPCFWGIHPDTTRYEELYSVIDNLGGSRFESSQSEGNIHVSSHFKIEENNGIFIEFGANLQDDIVKNLKIRLLNLYEVGVTVEDWSAYNFVNIQVTYGRPDKVELYFAQISDAIWFMVILKYERINTVLEYIMDVPEPEGDKYSTFDSVFFCPEEIGFGTVTLYLGVHPFNTFPSGLPLLKATGLNEQEFHNLFTENPSACLTLNRKAFYP